MTCSDCFKAGRFYLRCPVCRHACGTDPIAEYRAFGPPIPHLVRGANNKKKLALKRNAALRARRMALGLCYACSVQKQSPIAKAGLCEAHYLKLLARRQASERRRKCSPSA